MTPQALRIALVAGATGLIGRTLLPKLLGSPLYREVRALTRRPLGLAHPQLKELRADYAQLESLGASLAVDDVYCCLGTTLRQAGSRAAFEQVDHGHVVALARAAHAAGARRFLVISSVGTSERAAAFYSRVKARMEKDVAAIGFETTGILRPSLLLGDRQESRPGEKLGQIVAPWLAPLMRGPLLKSRAVSADEVAEAMLALARDGSPGVQVHHLPLGAA